MNGCEALMAAWHASRLGFCPSAWTPGSQLVGVWHFPQIADLPGKNCQSEMVVSDRFSGPSHVILVGESIAP